MDKEDIHRLIRQGKPDDIKSGLRNYWHEQTVKKNLKHFNRQLFSSIKGDRKFIPEKATENPKPEKDIVEIAKEIFNIK